MLTHTHTHHQQVNTCVMESAFYVKIPVKIELEEYEETKIKWRDGNLQLD